MFVSTFYSFKGGVGRTMALANIAHQLAVYGKRVLIVDFDLEAPGLNTLSNAAVANTTPGVVDYVASYLTHGSSPDIRDYVYRSTELSGARGEVLVMPAGRQDSAYAERLAGIDWRLLYEQHAGYLMFEDLRMQWEQALGIEYVLIDSRTGHTDVGGICTRQLPDLVVLFFLPNEQNVRGLRDVVRSIRLEAEESQRPDDLIFVISNLPDLDDEEEILQRRMASVKQDLGIEERVSLVHRYDSLALLDQTVFTRDRPRSRLAKEYRTLCQRIRMSNAEDRGGVLSRLKRWGHYASDWNVERRDKYLRSVELRYGQDGEVLFQLAKIHFQERRIGVATALLFEAQMSGFTPAALHLLLGEALLVSGDSEGATEYVGRIFLDSATASEDLYRAIELLRLTQPDAVVGVSTSPAVQALGPDERVSFAALLRTSREELGEAEVILSPILSWARGHEKWFAPGCAALTVTQIALGQFAAAIDTVHRAVGSGLDSVSYRFNEAAAWWGLEGEPDPDRFMMVLECVHATEDGVSPNFLQCLAITCAVIADYESARIYLQRARGAIRQQSTPEFSGWRYLLVTPAEFLQDLDEFERGLEANYLRPRFILQSL